MSNTNMINQLSPHLFWDVKVSELNWHDHEEFLVGRILEYGRMEDWILLRRRYEINEIANIAKKLRSLDDITFNFIMKISESKPEDFRCYTTKQSQPEHFGF